MFSLAGAFLEIIEFLAFRVVFAKQAAPPFGVVLIAAAVISFCLPLPPGVRLYCFGTYTFFKFFASPLAMMPLMKD
jgi:hypothetical protein